MSKLPFKQGPLVPLVRELLMAMLRRVPSNRSLMLATFQCTLTNKKLLVLERNKIKDFIQVLTPVIEAAQARGEITRIMPADMIADLAVQTYHGTLNYYGMGLGDDQLSVQMTRSFEIFIKGLAP
ncbi:hypothetical protein [Paenibacillus sp. N3.4]|uniref:hypothetical protein n=1 Tax=Paenibacillus sp. N3.4 TaxID=2603222 RepID=UPI0011C9D706|nr:hypothetical protein [Paenibacillus sp. N3.4]TXK72110.1 hypothetical protein FU659_31845 [Paenibacillus sp. N3.4]